MSQSNGEQSFAVHMSKNVAKNLKTVIHDSPRGVEMVASLKRIYERLQHDPWNFGEQRYHLYELRIQVRVAVVSPMAVTYGVGMDRPVVYVNGFVPLAGA